MSRLTRCLTALGATTTLALSGSAGTALAHHHGGADRHGGGQPTSGHGQGHRKGRAFALDRVWLKHIAESDLAEIATGTLAGQKGTTAATKELGARLVTDHTAHLQQTKTVAARLALTLPNQPNPFQQLAGQALATLSGTAFDQGFAALQVAAHLTAIDETQDEIAGGRYRPAVALAQATLPVLQAHLQMAQQLAAAVGPVPGTTPPTTGTTTPAS